MLDFLRLRQTKLCGFPVSELWGFSSFLSSTNVAEIASNLTLLHGGYVLIWVASDDDAFYWGEQNGALSQASSVHYIDETFQLVSTKVWLISSATQICKASMSYPADMSTWLGLVGNNPGAWQTIFAEYPMIEQDRTVREDVEVWDARIRSVNCTCEVLTALVQDYECIILPGHETESLAILGKSRDRFVEIFTRVINDEIEASAEFNENKKEWHWDDELWCWRSQGDEM